MWRNVCFRKEVWNITRRDGSFEDFFNCIYIHYVHLVWWKCFFNRVFCDFVVLLFRSLPHTSQQHWPCLKITTHAQNDHDVSRRTYVLLPTNNQLTCFKFQSQNMSKKLQKKIFIHFPTPMTEHMWLNLSSLNALSPTTLLSTRVPNLLATFTCVKILRQLERILNI